MEIRFDKPMHVYFIGIGGVSMSDLVSILLTEGFKVSGSDAKESELTRMPQNSTEVTDKDVARKLLLLLERIEEHDDVQNVYSNFDMDESLIGE